jgi:DNA-binding NarL/FixJ family response regulator
MSGGEIGVTRAASAAIDLVTQRFGIPLADLVAVKEETVNNWNGEQNLAELHKVLGAIIVSQTRILSDCLMEAFARDQRMHILGYCSTAAQALDMIMGQKPDFVLLDAAFLDAKPIVLHILGISPSIRVVALAIDETEDDVVAWAKAGACGYVPNTTPLCEVTDFLADIAQGRQKCSTDVAAGLLRRTAHEPDSSHWLNPPPWLTDRERDILRLIGAGLSNKDIARQLNISLATTKAHVHNLLGKLKVRRRGEATAWIHGQRPGQSTLPPPDGQPALWPDVRGALTLVGK